MEPSPQAGSLFSNVGDNYLPASIGGGQPATETAAPVSAPEEVASESPLRQLAEEKVKEWLSLPKGGLTRPVVRDECQKFPAELNWELLLYALEAIQPKLTRLNDNIRLLWIILGNLESLSYNKVVVVGG